MTLSKWEEVWMRKQDREAAERDDQDPADDVCALTRQMAENDRLRAEVARLREALQPFADSLAQSESVEATSACIHRPPVIVINREHLRLVQEVLK